MHYGKRNCLWGDSLLSLGVAIQESLLQKQSTECTVNWRNLLKSQLCKSVRLTEILAHANISVDKFTICKTLHKNGVQRETPQR